MARNFKVLLSWLLYFTTFLSFFLKKNTNYTPEEEKTKETIKVLQCPHKLIGLSVCVSISSRELMEIGCKTQNIHRVFGQKKSLTITFEDQESCLCSFFSSLCSSIESVHYKVSLSLSFLCLKIVMHSHKETRRAVCFLPKKLFQLKIEQQIMTKRNDSNNCMHFKCLSKAGFYWPK